MSAYADWRRVRADVPFYEAPYDDIQKLAAETLKAKKDVFDRLEKLVKAGTDPEKDLAAANPFRGFPFWVLPAGIIFDLILIFKLIASYGMFKLQSWGRILAIYVLSADFLLRLAAFINVLTYPSRHPEMIQRYNEMKSMPGHVSVETGSLIPSYIIGLLSLASVIVLITRPVKERFVRAPAEAQKSENA